MSVGWSLHDLLWVNVKACLQIFADEDLTNSHGINIDMVQYTYPLNKQNSKLALTAHIYQQRHLLQNKQKQTKQ